MLKVKAKINATKPIECDIVIPPNIASREEILSYIYTVMRDTVTDYISFEVQD